MGPDTNALVPAVSHLELMLRLLDASAASLAPERLAMRDFPDDEMHREIILPLLPAMLTDKAIQGYWNERAATGFIARLKTSLAADGARPQWIAADLEIHVAASYMAGPDARALADTLLSEESLREMTAAVLNTILEKVWPELTGPSAEPPSIPVLALVEELVPADNENSAIHFWVPSGRRGRRSIIRIPDAGTFSVRKMLSRSWFAQKNHP